jgi:hypothetical protein
MKLPIEDGYGRIAERLNGYPLDREFPGREHPAHELLVEV